MPKPLPVDDRWLDEAADRPDVTAAQWLGVASDNMVTEYNRRTGDLPPNARLVPLGRRRAVAVIRVSKTGKRKDKAERFVSPREQEARIRQWCASQGIELIAVYQELDVSGKWPLGRRPGLRPAVELIERGAAQVLIVAYFDRLVRSLRVQADVLERVEDVGGSVVALDVGEVSNETAAQWLNASMHGLMAEYYSRITSEKVAAAKRDAVERGVPPFPNIVPGYRRGDDGRLVVVPDEAKAVAEAFRMRGNRASLAKCRDFLRAHGIQLSYRATQTLFESRLVLGEIHYGKLVNLKAHEPIVDRAIWQRAKDVREPRGRPAKSDRLLARLGVLVCGPCGARLTAAHVLNAQKKRYALYRCGMPGDCPSPVTISATLVEEAVITEVRMRLLNRRGLASVEGEIRDAAAALATAEAALNNAVAMLTGLEDLESAQQKLADLRAAYAAAWQHHERLRASSEPLEVLSATHDWDELSVDGQRALIRAVLPRVEIFPATGRRKAADRVRERIHFP